jgi:hypothetical protein
VKESRIGRIGPSSILSYCTRGEAATLSHLREDREDFVAGGFWVDYFVGIGSRKKLEALKNGIDAKYGITRLDGSIVC